MSSSSTSTSTSTTSSSPTTNLADCVVDRELLNVDTIGNLTDMMGSIFGPSCGRNRGAFVLEPPDGQTYDCTNFPTQFAKQAKIDSSKVSITDANSVRTYLYQERKRYGVFVMLVSF